MKITWGRNRVLVALLLLLFCLPVSPGMAGDSPFPDLEGTHFYAVTQCGVLHAVFWITEGEDQIRLIRAIHNEETAKEVMAARKAARADGQVWIVRIPGGECRDT